MIAHSFFGEIRRASREERGSTMKKRVWKRILVVLLVLVVIVGAAGLVLVKSAADMVPRMQKRLEQATSIHYMYYMDIDASSLATTSSARRTG